MIFKWVLLDEFHLMLLQELKKTSKYFFEKCSVIKQYKKLLYTTICKIRMGRLIKVF